MEKHPGKHCVGIDLGSTATKVAIVDKREVLDTFLLPSGYSSVDASERVYEALEQRGFLSQDYICAATGYGRGAVTYADKAITEITCHAKGAYFLFQSDGVVIDVGGQDTKVITLKEGKVATFVMNDKCSAGTGRFLEIMANRLDLSQEELSQMAQEGSQTKISSMCTVFAETEIISLIGQGVPRENIAYGVIESVVSRICAMVPQGNSEPVFLTGGLCENEHLVSRLSDQLNRKVSTLSKARFAGAIGAALCLESVGQ